MSQNIIDEAKERLAIADLKEIKEVFDRYDIEFWLDCGTLLGAVRDRKFISWDCDIDLGTWEKDIVKIVSACRELQSKDFKINLGRNGIGLRKNASFLPISILFYRLSNNKVVKEWGNYKTSPFLRRFVNVLFLMFLTPCYVGIKTKGISGAKNFIRLSLVNIGYLAPSFIKKWAVKIEPKYGQKYLSIIPQHYFTTLSKIRFYGMEFKVPSKTEEYLVYRYGKDWRVPKNDWNGAKEDGTIFEN